MKSILTLSAIIMLQFNLSAQNAPQYTSPEIKGNNVTFRIYAPNANEVIIYGDFLPGINPYGLGGNTKLKKNTEGIWEYTALNLIPEFYFYYFEIDGYRVLDQKSLRVAHNFGEYVNTFLINGEKSIYYEPLETHKGSLSQVWYYSAAYGFERRMNVYTPFDYSSEKEYPVLYLQHGGGDDEETWVTMGLVCEILDHLIDEGKAVPMIVVIPNCMSNQIASQNVMDPLNTPGPLGFDQKSKEFRTGGPYVKSFTEEIIPYIESKYNVIKDKSGRAISGLSMGGIYTLSTIKMHSDMFDYIAIMGSGIFSGDPNEGDEILAPLKQEGYKLFWIGINEKDIAYNSGTNLIKAMNKNGLSYEFYDPQNGHNWRSWRRDLVDLAPRLFK
jgi:enterochelin esterase-like enzyme